MLAWAINEAYRIQVKNKQEIPFISREEFPNTNKATNLFELFTLHDMLSYSGMKKS